MAGLLTKQSGNGAATQQRQLVPGRYFGWPGVTRWTQFHDANSPLVTAIAQGTQTPMTSQTNFRAVDIAFGWRWDVAWAGTYTAGTGTLNTSQYFPYNAVGPIKLSVTNLYNALDLQSGIDLAIFNAYRPFRKGNNFAQSVSTAPSAWPYSPQTNNVTAGNYTSASTSMLLPYWIPACVWFDEYFELDNNGTIMGPAWHNVPVTPLYMSGTARDITPEISTNAGFGANTDQGPVVAAPAGTATFTGGSITSNFQRIGMYATKNVEEMPRIFNWRYSLASKRITLGAVSQFDFYNKQFIPNGGGGQLMSMFIRFFDPAAGANGQGAAIDLSTVSNAQMIYGSNLIRFDDTTRENEDRFYQQHNLRLPVGTWAWDLAQDFHGNTTNAELLNTYLTDVQCHFNFGSTLSSSAYAVVGTEYLTYVTDGPVIA